MKNSDNLTLSDRVIIESGLYARKSFKAIAKELGKTPETISREIRRNRQFISGTFHRGNDCRYAKRCSGTRICKTCPSPFKKCSECSLINCTTICPKYRPHLCSKIMRAPYVCNFCISRRSCINNRYIYSAKYADEKARARRSDAHKGLRTTGTAFEALDNLLAEQVKKGQPLTHIYIEHEDEIPITLRSMYNYIASGQMKVKNIDLRRKTKYRPRTKKVEKPAQRTQARMGRTYDDFQRYLSINRNARVVQMDTVHGKRSKGQTLLTMLFVDTNVMLIFLLPDAKANSVLGVLDMLTENLGIAGFRMLFGTILTDNGSEFKNAERIEHHITGEFRCNVFYCDPLASWQKAEIEKNHEYIRYVLPRKTDFDDLDQSDVTLLMNHINSTKRLGLGKRSPYELIDPDDEEMLWLMRILKMDIIPPDNVHLTPTLLR